MRAGLPSILAAVLLAPWVGLQAYASKENPSSDERPAPALDRRSPGAGLPLTAEEPEAEPVLYGSSSNKRRDQDDPALRGDRPPGEGGSREEGWQPSAADMATGLFFNRHYPKMRAWDYSQDSGWKKVGRMAGNVGLLVLGAAAAMAWHEIAHFIVASSLGVRFQWPAGGFDGPLLPMWEVEGATSSQRVAVASAGFIASAVATEVILWVPQIPKDNVFVVGLLLGSILNNLLYSLTDAVRGGYGDIEIMRQEGVNPAAIHIPLIWHSLIALGRLIFLDKQFNARFSPWFKPDGGGVDLAFRF